MGAGAASRIPRSSTDQPDVLCAMIRGRLVRPSVIVDEQAPGALEHLLTYQPHEIHVVESYYAGELIYVYTTGFVERLARSGRPLQPLIQARRGGG